MDAAEVAALTALEESLWRAESRFDRAYVERVFADDFEEFGRSGRHWTREAAIDLEAEDFVAVLPLPDLRVRAIGPEAALLTYRSETTFPDGRVLRAARSSVWQRIDCRWRLRFHQGTPVE